MGRLWFSTSCLSKITVAFSFAFIAQVSSLNDAVTAVAFYNMYVGPDEKTGIEYFPQILEEQISTMKQSGLLDRLDKIYYATVGEKGEKYVIDDDHFEKLKHHGHHADETQTLGLLYSYCDVNPEHYVMYFHNKGSWHYNPQNTEFRKALDCYVLNTNCIQVLDKYDVCGWRASLVPFIHYSGNFWWANCQYINKLVDPLSPMNNRTFIELTQTLNDCCNSKGRYFSESWIGSHPDINPADCMSSEDDTGFTFGYFFFPDGVINKQCEATMHPKDVAKTAVVNEKKGESESEDNDGMKVEESPWSIPNEEPDVSIETVCKKGSMFKDTELFRQAADNIFGLLPSNCQMDYKVELTRRSFYWYGQPMTTWLDTISRLYPPPNITELEGKAIKIPRDRAVYYVKDGVAHMLNDVNVFMRLGFDDFDQVITLRENDFNYIPVGELMT